MRRILWLDNDLAETKPYVRALARNGYDVTVVKSISECEALLELDSAVTHHDLLILDVMVPTKTEDEEAKYPPEITQRGTVTGLAVWKNWSSRLEQNGTKVLVLTVRLDQTVKDDFTAAQLPKGAFATKLDLSDTTAFVNHISRMIGTTNEIR
jgi:CheY-like chemotaxis protein